MLICIPYLYLHVSIIYTCTCTSVVNVYPYVVQLIVNQLRNIYSMVSRSVWDLSDPRLRVFLSPYQPEAKPRADMETETPKTKAKGLINPIQTY